LSLRWRSDRHRCRLEPEPEVFRGTFFDGIAGLMVARPVGFQTAQQGHRLSTGRLFYDINGVGRQVVQLDQRGGAAERDDDVSGRDDRRKPPPVFLSLLFQF
jgi:hypothetical protein